jgi:MoaA/NifB/PqqE/SkfB family radical SAM enzyme
MPETKSPQTLCVELTARCPLQCVHCSVAASPTRQTRLALADLNAALATGPSFYEVYLSGGEPTLHPDFLAIAQTVRAHTQRLILYGSGTSLSEGTLIGYGSDLIRQIRVAGINRVDISLYSLLPDEHDAQTRAEGSLKHTLSSIHALLENNISVGVHFVPLLRGAHHLAGIWDLACSLGLERVHVLAIAPQGRARHLGARRLEPDEVKFMASTIKSKQSPQLLLSSEIRREAGIQESSTRDQLRSLLLGADGHLYPGEGQRDPLRRTIRTIKEATLPELVRELAC